MYGLMLIRAVIIKLEKIIFFFILKYYSQAAKAKCLCLPNVLLTLHKG